MADDHVARREAELRAWRDYHAASRSVRPATPVIQNIGLLETMGLEYRFATHVPLEPGTSDDSLTVSQALDRRCSTRTFRPGVVEKAIVDRVVVRGYAGRRADDGGGRPAPSAGALYPVELYFIALECTGFDSMAIAHLNAHPHRPITSWSVLPFTADEPLVHGALLGQLPANTAGVFVLTATIAKSALKYGERAYRFCLIEVGHVAQNLTLALAAEGLGSVCLGGFSDHRLNGLLRIDGFDEAALYAVCFGYA